MPRRVFALAMLTAVAGCGSNSEPPPSCTVDEARFPKDFFVGDIATPGDEPTFSLTMTVVDAKFGVGPTDFLGATMSWQVMAQITHDSLVMHDLEEGGVASVFRVRSHEQSPCLQSESSDSPWSDRPWFRLDLTDDLVVDNYAFDAATAAGHPEAIEYQSLDFSTAPAPEVAFDEGYLAFEVASYVTWSPIDDDTPGCTYDLPDTAPTHCPSGELHIRYELQR